MAGLDNGLLPVWQLAIYQSNIDLLIQPSRAKL